MAIDFGLLTQASPTVSAGINIGQRGMEGQKFTEESMLAPLQRRALESATAAQDVSTQTAQAKLPIIQEEARQAPIATELEKQKVDLGKMKQDQEKIEFIHSALSNFQNLNHRDQQTAYPQLMGMFKSRNIPTDNFPSTLTPEAFKQIRTGTALTANAGARNKRLQAQIIAATAATKRAPASLTGAPPGSPEFPPVGAAAVPSLASQNLSTQPKSEQTANSQARTDAMKESLTARDMSINIDEMQATAAQFPTGLSAASWKQYMDTTGQVLKREFQAFILKRFEGMKHIGRGGTKLMNIIERSKPAMWNTPEAVKTMLNQIHMGNRYRIEKEQFTEKMWRDGITDRGVITSTWNKIGDAAPLVDKKSDKLLQNNLSAWDRLLTPEKIAALKARKEVNFEPVTIPAEKTYTFGKRQVTERDWKKRSKTLNPGISDEELDSRWKEKTGVQ